MRTLRPLVGLLALLFVAGHIVRAGDDKEKSADPPKEVNVVAYDSKMQGALQVKVANDKTGDWFDVLKDDKRAISGNSPLLGSTVELAPGAYVVEVNRTRRKVTIETGKKTILWTGELVVEGKGADWYIPYQGKDRKLVSNPPILNTPTALFAGTYTVNVHVNTEEKKLTEAEVKPGRKTVVKY